MLRVFNTSRSSTIVYIFSIWIYSLYENYYLIKVTIGNYTFDSWFPACQIRFLIHDIFAVIILDYFFSIITLIYQFYRLGRIKDKKLKKTVKKSILMMSICLIIIFSPQIVSHYNYRDDNGNIFI